MEFTTPHFETPAVETKAVTDADTHALHDEMMRTFEVLKASNDEHLAALRRQGDVLLEGARAEVDVGRLQSGRRLPSARGTRGRHRPAAREHLSDPLYRFGADDERQRLQEAVQSGDGVNKPTGFLHYTKVAEGSWTWGNIGYIATGVSAGFPASGPVDPLIDLTYALKAGYRQNGAFVMNRKTQSAIRKLKDVDGQYLWQPPTEAGGRASFLNFPVVEAEDMPDIAANTFAVAFGDFLRGYLIVDRAGVRVLRDPYSAKPYVLFYTTKRVGGGVQDFDAIKLLRFGVS